MAKFKKNAVGRRGFLSGAAAGAAGLIAKPTIAMAQQANAAAKVEASSNQRPGADFMMDVIKSLGIEYCATNPGTSFRGLHESMINYGGNQAPELLTCLHEESSVAMAHGYAKIEGKPMMIMAHGTVGLQHASMAIYNTYCDRVPVYEILGNILDINYRRGSADWYHSVQDAAATRGGGSGFGQSKAWTPHGEYSAGWRYELCAGRFVDRRTSQYSAAFNYA